ncbi:MAG: hypothetical protein QM817_31300 [Archangium sp.]
MTPVLLAVLAAGPAPTGPVAGAKHTLSISEARSISGTIGGRKAETEPLPQLGKVTVACSIVAADGMHPTSLQLTVSSGSSGLKGREFTAEVMSGELVLRDSKGVPTREQLDATRSFKPWIAGLLRDDPIVTAARSGRDGCSEDARAKVLDATAHEVHRLVGGDGPFELAPGGEATCAKKQNGTYQLKFTLTLKGAEYTAAYAFKGTVEIGPKAWHANLDLSGTAKFEMSGYGAKGKMTATWGVKSALK